jgi:hypothetical protein
MLHATRRTMAARGLRIGGSLIWLAAAIHFAALPLLRRTVAERLPPEGFAFVWPPFAFSFVLDGVLLVPLGFTALYCAGGVLRGERWATVLGLVSAVVVLVLPIIIVLVMGTGYFSAPAFLVATLVMVGAGLAMTIPLLGLVRRSAV